MRCDHSYVSAPKMTPLAAAVLEVGSPERILDIECGDGEAALFLSREFPSARVRGVDRSEQAIRRATARVGLDPEGRVAFKVGKPGSLPFPDNHFDLLTVVDAAPAPTEAARVLRSGGHLILARTDRKVAVGGVLRWRLAHRGFQPVHAEGVGDGSFAVLRMTAGWPHAASV
jgi:ubiquinone/menaquinone biosynthesis C-methylase UbiE